MFRVLIRISLKFVRGGDIYCLCDGNKQQDITITPILSKIHDPFGVTGPQWVKEYVDLLGQ